MIYYLKMLSEYSDLALRNLLFTLNHLPTNALPIFIIQYSNVSSAKTLNNPRNITVSIYQSLNIQLNFIEYASARLSYVALTLEQQDLVT